MNKSSSTQWKNIRIRLAISVAAGVLLSVFSSEYQSNNIKTESTISTIKNYQILILKRAREIHDQIHQ